MMMKMIIIIIIILIILIINLIIIILIHQIKCCKNLIHFQLHILIDIIIIIKKNYL